MIGKQEQPQRSGISYTPPRTYDDAKRMACDPDRNCRIVVADCQSVAPEILYFMTDDPDADVRRRVAANPTTPRQADGKLANDEDPGVRKALARKIASVASEPTEQLANGTHARLTLDILDKLARDQFPVVRQVVAEVLKSEVNVPHHVVQRLARDIDIVVAAPVLEFSPILKDKDLVAIIENSPISGALTAISKRDGVSGEVSNSIAQSDDPEAIVSLLNNPTAQLREDTLDSLIERSRAETVFQEPLVRRPTLPGGAACRLATFVADSLLSVLESREDLDDETMKTLRSSVRFRLEQSYAQSSCGDELTPERMVLNREYASAQAQHAKTPLSEAVICRSLDYEHWDYVTASLAVMSDLSLDLVLAVLASKDADLITALCWKAGISVGTACLIMQLQLDIIPPKSLFGTSEYPYPPVTMDQRLNDFAYTTGLSF